MEQARRALPGDAELLHELARAARAELATKRGGPALLEGEDPGRGGANAVVEEDGQARRGAPTETASWLGEIDGTPVGYTVVTLTAIGAGDLATTRGTITELWVEPEAREVGVGGALLEAAVDWLRDKGASSVDAVALPGDRSTKRLFEASGLTARLLVLHRRLDR